MWGDKKSCLKGQERKRGSTEGRGRRKIMFLPKKPNFRLEILSKSTSTPKQTQLFMISFFFLADELVIYKRGEEGRKKKEKKEH